MIYRLFLQECCFKNSVNSFRRNKINYFSTVSEPEKKIKYTDTILLPKTTFPPHLSGKKVVKRDEDIQKVCGFSELYSWQRENFRGKEFVLHDGPPYANGKPHIGHAVNKILKDITLRSKLIQGRKVHFVPGWDCHGLPIELKALTKGDTKLDPVSIRAKARDFAKSSAEEQMRAFQSWGVLGNWSSDVYYTYDTSYVINQLQMFWKLYEKGYLYRDLKPVYWSPSSKSALAESELIYKEDHESEAVTVQFELSSELSGYNSVKLLIWTTTPWTLPSNQAVCYSNNLNYCLVQYNDDVYLICRDSVDSLNRKLNTNLEVVKHVDNVELDGLRYFHPWCPEETKKLLVADHVTCAGTGLVHTAPAHGHDDFIVGIANKLKLDCKVDEEGKFTADVPELSGMKCLEEGNNYVVDKLKCKILHREKYKHSYPYDWRTNKPIIIRSSQQWFIDTYNLKNKSIEHLSKLNSSKERLESLVQSRPYWCVSRQRHWGVPIPVFYHKTSGRPLITKQSVDHLCHVFERHGPDSWWSETTDKLLPAELRRDMFVKIEEVERGADIMDIWLDSGLSWSHVLRGRVADLCVEGCDQYTGWFQSSLLTSVALHDRAPYKRLLTHGFTVDEAGRKMSKSVGNVIDPQSIVRGDKARGVDSLRWFVASHFHHQQIPVSDRLVDASAESVQKIRLIFRFLLGSLHGTHADTDFSLDLVNCHLDRYYVNQLERVYDSVMKCYDDLFYNQVCLQLNNFFSNLSSVYLHVIKDRLYCDDVAASRRRSAIATLNLTLETLVRCIAPILPHLAEEVYLHHPVYRGARKLFYDGADAWTLSVDTWSRDDISSVVAAGLCVKEEVDRISGPGGTQHLSAVVKAGQDVYSLLKRLQKEDLSADSELTELLQLSSIELKLSTSESDSNAVKVLLSKTELERCVRCRRYVSQQEPVLCTRCLNVVNMISRTS